MNKLSSSSNVTEVQATSLLVSYWRYKEAKKPQGVRLIDDLPDEILLDALLTREQRELFECSPVLERGIDALALRTRFIDDWLLHRLPQSEGGEGSDHGCSAHFDIPSSSAISKAATIINLGAGMDTRPYRLKELAGLQKYIEIDSNLSLLELKHSILRGGRNNGDDSENTSLQPHCSVTRAEADLSDPIRTRRILEEEGIVLPDSETGGQGHSRGSRETIDFIAEGLFAYLDPSSHKELLRMCHDISGEGSRMVLTVLDPSGVRNFQSDDDKSGPSGSFEIPWKQLVPINQLVQQAKECGWKQVNVWQLNSLFEVYDRNPVSDLRGYAILTLAKS
jgi:O-methyltransferase involved in polyketide biosynthesis